MQVIKLGNTEFEGRNNAYLVAARTVTLVDTGVATAETREQLRTALTSHRYDFADVDRVLLTHYHSDHAGLVGEIERAGGTEVLVHEADAPLVTRDPEAIASLRTLQERRFEEWGMPQRKREELLARLDAGGDLISAPDSVDVLRSGDEIDLGAMTVSVLHTPGHTAGHCCFVFEGERGREAFVGDSLLPKYTPNVGGADVRVDDPLERYLRTLETLIERDFRRVWPGHRDVIEAPAERARTIRRHHRDRTHNVMEVLRSHGPADAWTVSDHLFGDLQGIHVLHGPGEAFAHLDHLERKGIIERTAEGYRPLVEAPQIDELV